MPKNISLELKAALQQPVQTLAVCWKITRRDNQVFGFTSHDRDLIIDGVTYKANTGILPGAFSSDSKLSVNNLDLQGFLQSGSLTETDIRAGLFDGSPVQVFIVDYTSLPPNLSSNDLIWIVKGYLGEIRNEGGNFFTAEIRGATQILQQTIGSVLSPACRYVFGDSRCTKDLSGLTHTGVIWQVSLQYIEFRFDLALLTPSAPPTEPYFTGGKVTFTTGNNAGYTFDIAGRRDFGYIKLLFPAPKTFQVGDAFTIVAGCAKSLAACQSFNNVINFGGEPKLPGNDAIVSGNFG